MSFLPELVRLGTSIPGAARLGAAVYRSEVAAHKVPSPFGRKVVDHTQNGGAHEGKDLSGYSFGYHGTTWKRVDSQVAQGAFDDRGQGIYFGNPELAHLYSRSSEEKEVILKIGSKGAPIKDTVFGTWYFNSGHPVIIEKAYEVNPEYAKKMKAEYPGKTQIGAISKAWNVAISYLTLGMFGE